MVSALEHVPGWYALILLSLAAFRCWRILAADTILRPYRERLIGRSEQGAKEAWPGYRRILDEFMHCPWCLGWWITLGWWLAWVVWPRGTLIASVPFALSSLVGLVAHKLDDK